MGPLRGDLEPDRCKTPEDVKLHLCLLVRGGAKVGIPLVQGHQKPFGPASVSVLACVNVSRQRCC